MQQTIIPPALPLTPGCVQQRECSFCFRRQDCEEGLFFSVETLLCVCIDHIKLLERGSPPKDRTYINIVKKLNVDKTREKNQSKAKKIALNTEDGFQTDLQDEYDETIFFYNAETNEKKPFDPFSQHQYANQLILIQQSQDYYANLMSKQISSWDGDFKISYPDAEFLYQIESPPKITNSAHKCELCDKTQNLWLNLSDGKILCGRKYFDGSGGNNHAVEHYEKTGYPLAVKLGSITSTDADVYCYSLDEMVNDPYLTKHLAHFGINCANLQKTEKSQMELELELNQNGFSKFTQNVDSSAGNKRVMHQKSPGMIGLQNIGNTCYMASVLQCLSRIRSLVDRFVENSQDLFIFSADDPNEDLNVQIAKLFNSLVAVPVQDLPTDAEGWTKISPDLFKLCAGKNHKEFSTNRQQDCSEFLLHLLTKIEEANTSNLEDPLEDLRFHVVSTTKKNLDDKNITIDNGYVYDLPVTVTTSNHHESKLPQADVELADLILESVSPDRIAIKEDVNGTTVDSTILRNETLAFLPKNLIVCAKRFSYDSSWNPVKLDTKILFPNDDVNAELDFSALITEKDTLFDYFQKNCNAPNAQSENKSNQNQHNNILQPDLNELNDSQLQLFAQLESIGFTNKSANFACVQANSNIDSCLNWLMDNQDKFASEITLKSNQPPDDNPSIIKPLAYTNIKISDENVSLLTEMGYSKILATDALKFSDNSLEMALELIMSHPDGNFAKNQMTSLNTEKQANACLQHKHELTLENFQNKSDSNTSNKCRLRAFIVHSGKTVHNGHYVAYVRSTNDEKWYLFNDEKVFIATDLSNYQQAYLYFFEQIP